MKTIALAIAGLVTLAGCASTPNYDARFGDAVRQARVAMTVNPAGSSMSDPVAGIEGQAAKEAMNRYYESFKSPPPVVNVINIGGVSSAK